MHYDKHISSFLIDRYIKELTFKPLPNNENIIKAKQLLQANYIKAEKALRNAFNDAIKHIDSLVFQDDTATKYVNGLQLNDKACQALK